jgi:hypothetical protein
LNYVNSVHGEVVSVGFERYSDYISYARNYEFEIVNENEIRIRYFHDEPNFEKENCLFIDNLK